MSFVHGLHNAHCKLQEAQLSPRDHMMYNSCNYKNSSVDEIANVNFHAVRPEDTRIRWNNAK